MRTDTSRTADRLLMLLLAAGFLSLAARPAPAATFSFGTVGPTDLIQSVVIAPEELGLQYDSVLGQLVISSYISTINFMDGSSIAINPGDVTFASQLDVVGSIVLEPLPMFLVTTVHGEFSKPVLADYSIIDQVGTGGGPIGMIVGDYDANLTLDISSVTSVILGAIAADLTIGGALGNGDFLAALGSTAHLGGTPVVGTVVGTNLCSTALVTCGVFAQLNSFNAPSGLVLTTDNVAAPEPGSGLLLALGLVGIALRRRI